jgi:hypothetical protein
MSLRLTMWIGLAIKVCSLYSAVSPLSISYLVRMDGPMLRLASPLLLSSSKGKASNVNVRYEKYRSGIQSLPKVMLSRSKCLVAQLYGLLFPELFSRRFCCWVLLVANFFHCSRAFYIGGPFGTRLLSSVSSPPAHSRTTTVILAHIIYITAY